MPEAIKLMGMNARNQLVPLRLDDKGRLELVQVQSGDEAAPTLTLAAGSVMNSTKGTQYMGAVLLGTTETTVFTAPAGTYYRNVRVTLAPVDGLADYIYQLFFTPSGGTAKVLDRDTLVKDSGGTQAPYDGAIGMAPGDKISGLEPTGNKVWAIVWGEAFSLA
jgi:hypothetical protein